MTEATTLLEDRRLGPHTTALLGERGGKYPDANALLVRGKHYTALIDAPLGVVRRLEDGRLDGSAIDTVILTHCHEDHVPALASLPGAEVWVHSADRPGLASLDAFLDVFGYPEPDRTSWAGTLRERFRFVPRPDARSFEDGHRFELGGGVEISALHAPGHTRGHCLFRVLPDDVLFLADLDLSSFGPYYADAWSDLDDLERTLERAGALEASCYLTGHHVGVLDPAAYRARLARYRLVIESRNERMLAFLAEPRTIEEMVVHRFVYRAQDDVPGIDRTERATALRHLERLERAGRVVKVESRKWKAPRSAAGSGESILCRWSPS
jgi:glyoxylase-like metal-dependent hydrolase (beta-lactamase superfamily II)